jgi:hypothetical protein
MFYAVLCVFAIIPPPQEKAEEDPRLTSRMDIARTQMEEILLALGELQDMYGVLTDPDARSSLNFGLAAVSHMRHHDRDSSFSTYLSFIDYTAGALQLTHTPILNHLAISNSRLMRILYCICTYRIRSYMSGLAGRPSATSPR